MTQSHHTIKIYTESGQKKTIAAALEWPGWCRGGKDLQTALETMLDYAPRYANALLDPQFGFQVPGDLAQFEIAERLRGNTTTDFGAPAVAASFDKTQLDAIELGRLLSLLGACWEYFDQTVRQTAGQELRKGPRGGGRDLESIINHVLEGERAYLRRLAWKLTPVQGLNPDAALNQTRKEIRTALESAIVDGLPESGPRGGAVWTPRYFIRRAAWHVLDHAWEIEDRRI